MNLYEKYRPRTFDSVLGQSKAVTQIRRILARGWGGRAWWISGASGTGKTTLAKIIAAHGADVEYVSEYDCADTVSVSTVDSIADEMCYYAGGKGGRAFIVNEAHGLRKPVIRRLLGLLERIPDHCCFIFTTTKQGEQALFDDHIDANPLLSRCVQVALTNQGLAQTFAEYCRLIATRENLNGKPINSYMNLARKHNNNCRAMLMSIESGVMLQ